MKSWAVGISVALLSWATPLRAEESHGPAVEAGVVMGLVQPYLSGGIVAGRWAVRVSGGGGDGCSGQQLNVGRVVRDEGNAKHTIGAVWGRFNTACWYGERNPQSRQGRYVGLAYDFQVKGFFIEVGPAFGARNPVGVELDAGVLTRVYGQIGYVHRFGKKYVADDEPESFRDGRRAR